MANSWAPTAQSYSRPAPAQSIPRGPPTMPAPAPLQNTAERPRPVSADVRLGRRTWDARIVREQVFNLADCVFSQHKHLATAVSNVSLDEDTIALNNDSCSLKILSWNIHGGLASKLLKPSFCKVLEQFDVVLLQETHLRPEQEHQLTLPAHYVMFVESRPNSEWLGQTGGGVVTLVRSSLLPTARGTLSGPDLLVVNVADICIVNCYLPPCNSRWAAFATISPDEKLAQTMAACCANSDNLVLLAGDLNARTNTQQPLVKHFSRTSPDKAAVSGHGRFVLQLGSDCDLQILNGSLLQNPPSLHLFTSFQPNGRAVIDYFLASSALLQSGLIQEMDIHHLTPGWSDHAMVTLSLSGPPSECPRRSVEGRIGGTSARVSMPVGSGPLDILLQDTLKGSQSLDEALSELYGPVQADSAFMKVHTDGCCLRPGSPAARAGAGIFWGPGDLRNTACRVTGPQTNNRAELAAILNAILLAPSAIALKLFTDSQYAIHSICHWAPRWAASGWHCANADLLRDIVKAIHHRLAPIKLIWVKGHAGNLDNEHADRLADQGARLPGPVIPYVSVEPSVTTQMDMPILRLCGKVVTTLHAMPIPPTQVQLPHPDPKLTGLDPLHLQLEWNRQDDRLKRLMTAKSQGDFWKEWKQIILPAEFDALRHRTNHNWMSSLPSSTEDSTPECFFSRRVTVEEVESVKQHIKTHTMRSAKGADKVNYAYIMTIPNDNLRALFQACIHATDAPIQWLTTILAAIGKRGNDLTNPENYRTIGLESCLVKFLTLLIDRRIRVWAEARSRLPPSQNGFRAGHRTCNNAFVLRTAIDKAASNGQLLYTCFVDLRNVFPSVDQPTLWRKLHDWGASGPIIDWLRMLYSRMSYIIRFGGEVAESFQAFAGILIGDPASPILWILYLTDFTISDQASDISLNGVHASHLEQADDIVLFSTSPEGLQSKLDQLVQWCRRNFMLIHAIKSKGMMFNGPLPIIAPRLLVNGLVIEWVKEYCYVGMLFCSTDRYIFARHIAQRTANARKGGKCIPLPRILCGTSTGMGTPNPLHGHVALDVESSHSLPLQKLQHTYLRRLLGLNKRSATVVLFTETGLWPILFRRAQLALRYLIYVMREEPVLPMAALDEAYTLANAGHASWYSDLCHVLQKLPTPIRLDLSTKPTVVSVSVILTQLESSLIAHLESTIANSPKFVLIQDRADYSSKERHLVHKTLAFRTYLRVQIFKHRRALARLVASDHPLAVEQLRRVARCIPRESRTCRFCKIYGEVESETHVLLSCTDSRLVLLRENFMQIAFATSPALVQQRQSMADLPFLRALLSREATIELLGAYVHKVFLLCAEVPMTFPVGYGTAP
ncbi:hypothetical protein PHLCEN_2v12270 [Hermanssonia centrifuga]|uniref:Uncharacterized protein n=1 Tax=Hermanssonia centrifuga TaxID=98765 RepID=A0A2R6NHJ6_9APHY|nr:hypothetical protein PHLCEN_2v12270 [Hermanssonia centrifuga]